jgi:D-3-phosphoglycerate dehydrogenase
MSRVVFPDCTPYMARFYDAEMRALLPDLEVDVASPTAEEVVARLQGCLGAFHFYTRLTGPMLARLPDLRVTVFLGTGVGSWIDLEAARRLGIRVRRVLGYGDRTVAEHALALVLAVARKVAVMDRGVRSGAWRCEALSELEGKTLGLIGLGGVGRAMAKLATGFGFRVIGWNRSPVPADVPCRMMDLDQVLAESDVVSVHLALNDETRGIIDRRRLGLLKPGAFLVNTARGALVDEAALAESLAAGRLAGAGLDVFGEEPLPAGHPLARLDNVTLTAHAAWMSPEAARRLLRLGLETMRDELQALGAGSPPAMA